VASAGRRVKCADAGPTTLSTVSLRAEKPAISTTEDSPVTGGGGRIKILAGKVSSLAVARATVRDHAIGAGEFLTMLSKAIGAELYGMLGYDFLNQFKVTIDYPRGTLSLCPASIAAILKDGVYANCLPSLLIPEQPALADNEQCVKCRAQGVVRVDSAV
jgi:hypothetical protein